MFLLDTFPIPYQTPIKLGPGGEVDTDKPTQLFIDYMELVIPVGRFYAML